MGAAERRLTCQHKDKWICNRRGQRCSMSILALVRKFWVLQAREAAAALGPTGRTHKFAQSACAAQTTIDGRADGYGCQRCPQNRTASHASSLPQVLIIKYYFHADTRRARAERPPHQLMCVAPTGPIGAIIMQVLLAAPVRDFLTGCEANALGFGGTD